VFILTKEVDMQNDHLLGAAMKVTCSVVGRKPGKWVPHEQRDNLALGLLRYEAVKNYADTISLRRQPEALRSLVDAAIDWLRPGQQTNAIVHRYSQDLTGEALGGLGERERRLHTCIFMLAAIKGAHVVASQRYLAVFLEAQFGDVVHHPAVGRSLERLESAGLIELEVGKRTPGRTKSTIIHIRGLRPVSVQPSRALGDRLTMSPRAVAALWDYVAGQNKAQPTWAAQHPRKTASPANRQHVALLRAGDRRPPRAHLEIPYAQQHFDWLAWDESDSQQLDRAASVGWEGVDLLAVLDAEDAAEGHDGEVDLVQDYVPAPEGGDGRAAEITPTPADTEAATPMAAAVAQPHASRLPCGRMPVHCGCAHPQMPLRGRCGHLQLSLARGRGIRRLEGQRRSRARLERPKRTWAQAGASSALTSCTSLSASQLRAPP
jgi:hypothetical protein